jgi:hypothetical protein
MGMQQSKAGISQEPGSILAEEPSSRQLRIQFFPVVAFAVSCKPGEIEPADKQREGSRSSMHGTCPLSANIGPGTLAVPGNACAPGQS